MQGRLELEPLISHVVAAVDAADAFRLLDERPRGRAGRARLLVIDYRPSFPPGYRPGIGIVGCGQIVRNAHCRRTPRREVVGVYDVLPAATHGLELRVFETLDELLAEPAIEIVDIATPRTCAST